MQEVNNTELYDGLVERMYERCQEVQYENERLVHRTNKIKKLVQRCGRDVELLKRRLDRYNDNWRALPMVLPHPKRKIEQKRGPKPKPKPAAIATNEPLPADAIAVSTTTTVEAEKKVRKQRARKVDKEAAARQQQEAAMLRQQKRLQLQQQRQREQQALKLMQQQQRQLQRQQKQLAQQQLKQLRLQQRQQQRLNVQQHKRQLVPTPSLAAINTAMSKPVLPTVRFASKVTTTYLTPLRMNSFSSVSGGSSDDGGDMKMPPPPPPPKIEHFTEQQAHMLLMHKPLHIVQKHRLNRGRI